MALTLTDIQLVNLGVSPKSAAGNPALIESPVWSSSDESIVTVAVDPSGLNAVATTTGKIGSAQVKFECDAQIGDGIKPLFAVLDIDVVPSDAINIGIVAGSPEDKQTLTV